MAAEVSLATLVTRTLRRADMASPDQFPDTSTGGEVETYLQQAARELYDFLLTSWGEDYFITSATLTTVAGTATVALPADFYKLLGVDAQLPGASSPQTLRPFNMIERNLFPENAGWTWSAVIPMYRLFGASSVWFIPTPQAAYSITMYYVPAMEDIDSSTNLFDGINGWDEYLEVRAAIKLLRREESDTSGLEHELQQIKERIANAKSPRDIGAPQRVTDIWAVAPPGWDDL